MVEFFHYITIIKPIKDERGKHKNVSTLDHIKIRRNRTFSKMVIFRSW
jgi:hypothetical protein